MRSDDVISAACYNQLTMYSIYSDIIKAYTIKFILKVKMEIRTTFTEISTLNHEYNIIKIS